MPLSHRLLVLPSHQIALVGEDPGKGLPEWALYPYPPGCAGARLIKVLAMSRSEYLATFARANVLAYYPGRNYPMRSARSAAQKVAESLSPRSMILLGRKVAKAFQLPTQDHMSWQEYDLGGVPVRAASIPHPSGRNLFYNDPRNCETVRQWVGMVLYDLSKAAA